MSAGEYFLQALQFVATVAVGAAVVALTLGIAGTRDLSRARCPACRRDRKPPIAGPCESCGSSRAPRPHLRRPAWSFVVAALLLIGVAFGMERSARWIALPIDPLRQEPTLELVQRSVTEGNPASARLRELRRRLDAGETTPADVRGFLRPSLRAGSVPPALPLVVAWSLADDAAEEEYLASIVEALFAGRDMATRPARTWPLAAASLPVGERGEIDVLLFDAFDADRLEDPRGGMRAPDRWPEPIGRVRRPPVSP